MSRPSLLGAREPVCMLTTIIYYYDVTCGFNTHAHNIINIRTKQVHIVDKTRKNTSESTISWFIDGSTSCAIVARIHRTVARRPAAIARQLGTVNR